MLTRAISGDGDTSSHIVPEEVSIALFAIYNETMDINSIITDRSPNNLIKHNAAFQDDFSITTTTHIPILYCTPPSLSFAPQQPCSISPSST